MCWGDDYGCFEKNTHFVNGFWDLHPCLCPNDQSGLDSTITLNRMEESCPLLARQGTPVRPPVLNEPASYGSPWRVLTSIGIILFCIDNNNYELVSY